LAQGLGVAIDEAQLSAASRRAVAAPIPDAAPVMTAIRLTPSAGG
jgi:hypothetical protein